MDTKNTLDKGGFFFKQQLTVSVFEGGFTLERKDGKYHPKKKRQIIELL
jgi:hypothetical protein